MDYVFGLTAGNDLTERSWQGRDLQWMRAKAADGFGPVGPALVTGLDANNVLLTTRLNGEIVQQENTRNMIHKTGQGRELSQPVFHPQSGGHDLHGDTGPHLVARRRGRRHRHDRGHRHPDQPDRALAVSQPA